MNVSTTRRVLGSPLLMSFITSIILFLIFFSNVKQAVISPWDETYHLSYVQYIYNGHLPRFGDWINSWSRHALQCFPVHPFGFVTKYVCDEIFVEVRNFPEGGLNTAAGWPPLYYMLTALILKVLSFDTSNVLFVVRTISLFFWSIGFGFLVHTYIKMRVNGRIAVPITLLIALLPISSYQSTYVTPYSLLPLMSSFGLRLFLRNELRKSNIFLWASFSILSVLTVPHFLTVFWVFILLRLFFNFNLTSRINHQYNYFISNYSVVLRQLLLPFISSILAIITYLIWQRFQMGRTSSHYVNLQGLLPLPIDLSFVNRVMFSFLDGALNFSQYCSNSLILFTRIASLLFTLLIFFNVFKVNYGVSRVFRNLGLSIVLASSLSQALFELLLKYPIPPRYLLPFVFFLPLLFSGVVFKRVGFISLTFLALLGIVSNMISNPFGSF